MNRQIRVRAWTCEAAGAVNAVSAETTATAEQMAATLAIAIAPQLEFIVQINVVVCQQWGMGQTHALNEMRSG